MAVGHGITIIFVWIVTQCSLVRGAKVAEERADYLNPSTLTMEVPGSYEKILLPSTKLHVVISQKTATFILAYFAGTEENHGKESE